MITFLNVVFCILIPGIFALVSTCVSLGALRCHVSRRQFIFTCFVLTANSASALVIGQELISGQSVSGLPIALISCTLVLAFAQFLVANLFGAIDRLREKLA